MKLFETLKSNWNSLLITVSWLISISSIYILPLPKWSLDSSLIKHHSNLMSFSAFISTLIPTIITILIIKKTNLNLKALIIIFIITSGGLVTSYYLYSSSIENKTLPYLGERIVVGNFSNPIFQSKLGELEDDLGYKILNSEILTYSAGNATVIWSEEEILNNRNIIVVYMSNLYCIFTIFILLTALLISTLSKKPTYES